MVGGGGRTFVEAHSDVGIEEILNLDGLFWSEEEWATVELGFEMDAIFRNIFLFVLGEGENLVTAGVGQDGAGPMHKLVQTAGRGDNFGGGAEPEMVGVGQDDAGVSGGDLLRREGFDRGLGADRHKHRGLVDLVAKTNRAEASGGVLIGVMEGVFDFVHNLR